MRLGVEPGRPRRHLPAHVPRGRGRLARVRAPRRGPGAALLRLRRAGRRRSGCRTREAKVVITADGSLRRGQPAADEGDRRGGASAGAVRRARRRLGARLGLGRDRRGQPRRAAAARGRLRAPVPAHLHLGHDRQAEGRRARPGRLPRLDRARGRLPGGRAPGRRPPLRHGHGLDHGAVDGGRRRARSAARIVFAEGAPDWPADRLWQLVEYERVSILGLSPTLVRALIPHGEPDGRPLLPPASSSRRASPGTPIRTAGSSRRSEAGAARSSTARAGPRSARASSRPRRRSRSRSARSAGPRSEWRWTSSTPTGDSLVDAGEVGELVCRGRFPG